MTNNPICFVCGAPGAACLLSTKPQSRGAFFAFLTSHAPPDGASLPDPGGCVSACLVCKALLTEQWNSYERHKTPISERIFWLKRVDDRPFTGAEMNVQGELVAQYIGIGNNNNNNGISAPVLDDTFDHSSHDSSKFPRKAAAWLPGVNVDTEDTSSSFDDASGVLDLSTSPKKGASRVQSKCEPAFAAAVPCAKGKNSATTEKRTRTRQNSAHHNNSKFVCYICRETFGSPQKSRFLSCSFTADDEPYFPFVRALARPEGAKEITKSGLAEVCCDCRKSLSRQWRVFETRKVPVEKRVYEVEPVVSSLSRATDDDRFCIDENLSRVNSMLGYAKAKNCNEKPRVINNNNNNNNDDNLSKCFACLQTTDALRNIDGGFLKSKPVHVIGLLPLSRKLLEVSNSKSSSLFCCERCLQVLLLERRVLEKSDVCNVANKTPSPDGRHFQAQNSTKSTARGGSIRSDREVKLISSQFSAERSPPPLPDAPKEHTQDQNNSCTPRFYNCSSARVCFLCRDVLEEDGELFALSQRTSAILHLMTLTSSARVKRPGEVIFCGKCCDYLLPSLLKDFKRSPTGEVLFNGGGGGYDGCDSFVRSTCFYCSSREETGEPGFLLVGIDSLPEDVKSIKLSNLIDLGVRQIAACSHCSAARNKMPTTTTTTKRKASDFFIQTSSKIARKEFSEDVRQENHTNAERERPTSTRPRRGTGGGGGGGGGGKDVGKGVAFLSEHEKIAAGAKNRGEFPATTTTTTAADEEEVEADDLRLCPREAPPSSYPSNYRLERKKEEEGEEEEDEDEDEEVAVEGEQNGLLVPGIRRGGGGGGGKLDRRWASVTPCKKRRNPFQANSTSPSELKAPSRDEAERLPLPPRFPVHPFSLLPPAGVFTPPPPPPPPVPPSSPDGPTSLVRSLTTNLDHVTSRDDRQQTTESHLQEIQRKTIAYCAETSATQQHYHRRGRRQPQQQQQQQQQQHPAERLLPVHRQNSTVVEATSGNPDRCSATTELYNDATTTTTTTTNNNNNITILNNNNNNKTNRTPSDGTDARPTIYRPFSEEDDDNDDDQRTTTKRKPRATNGHRVCPPDRPAPATPTAALPSLPLPLPLAEVATGGSADEVKAKDERLTAALGLISLCHSKFSTGSLPEAPLVETETSPSSSSSSFSSISSSSSSSLPVAEVESHATSTCSSAPPSGVSELREATAAAAAADDRRSTSEGFQVVEEAEPADQRTIRWPGVRAIVRSYREHVRDTKSQMKCLLSARSDLRRRQEELVASKNQLETSLKDFFLEKCQLEEECRRLTENILLLKSCLTSLSQD